MRIEKGITAGEWAYEPDDDGTWLVVGSKSDERHIIAEVYWTGLDTDVLNDGEANARLMAAAPALLDACRQVAARMRRALDGQPPHRTDCTCAACVTLGVCEDAITEATGEVP